MAYSLSAPDYIHANFQPPDRIAILMRSRNRGEVIQRISTAEKIASPEFQAWLAFKNVEGFDVYIGMNTLKPGSYSRTKQDIETIRHLYADLDYDGRCALAAIENSELVPKPNFVLDTSLGKYQIVWKVEGIKPEEAENLQQAIAYEFGADPAATDSARVLRLPGFANKKYDDGFPVIARQQTTQTYHAWDFKLRTPSVEAKRQIDQTRQSLSKKADHTSQSERDWAYAKRALARGDDPEEIVRRIADYRADDKHNPEYYARHTVSKAQSHLNRLSSLQTPVATPGGEVGPEHSH
jgi:RepB DNA-primase from phage plasmid